MEKKREGKGSGKSRIERTSNNKKKRTKEERGTEQK